MKQSGSCVTYFVAFGGRLASCSFQVPCLFHAFLVYVIENSLTIERAEKLSGQDNGQNT